MKQKRKVKCLLPNKIEWRKNILSALLFILSVVLCVGSVSLLTSCAWADDITFTGLDEKAEVLYEINFVKQNDARANISNMYVSGGNLYVTHAPLIVNTNVNYNQNTISNDKYGHILGGRGNNLYSKYVTLIGGHENNIFRDNIVLLGGNNNNITGVLAVVIGGNNNKIAGTTSNSVIIGGNNHKIDNGSNHFILGGSGIAIKGQTDGLNKNIIFGGLKVQDRNSSIDRRSNIFAYSNSNEQFIPKTNNAFYLDVIGGVGFNRPSANKGLAVSGAVSIGEIDKNALCNENTLGVVGSYSGCLVGCTDASRNAGEFYRARELLDLSNECKTTCKNWKDDYSRKKCLYTGETNNSINNQTNDYTSFCLTGNSIYNFDNTVLCDENKPNEYKNVVFEATLTGNCSSNRENICEYKCKEGYNLFNPSGNKYECIEGCDIKIDSIEEHLTHGSTITLSTTGEVYECDSECDEKSYICLTGALYEYEKEEVGVQVSVTNFSSTCKKFNCCDGNVKHGGTGTFYKTGSVTCTGACEGAEFTCNNGNWNNEQSGYTASSCNLEGKICSGYNITQKYYDEIILDKGYDKLGTYKKCTEYNVNNSNLCTTGETKYMLEGCNNGYHVHNPTPGNYDYCESNYHITACPGEVPENGHRLNNVKIIKNGKEEYAGTGKYFVEYICPRNITNPEGNNCRYHDSKKYCKWECDEGYRKARDDRAEHLICKSERKNDYNCISPDDHAYLVEGTDEGLTENITGTLFQFTGDITGKCAYLCDNDGFYYYFNGKCEPFIETNCDYDNDNCESPSTKGNGSGFYETENGSKRNCILIGNDGDPIIKKCAYCNSGFSIYISGELYGGYIDNMSPEQFNEFECLKQPTCNHCAKSGFPYCFPIDFRDSCDEFRWAASRENGIGYGSGV